MVGEGSSGGENQIGAREQGGRDGVFGDGHRDAPLEVKFAQATVDRAPRGDRPWCRRDMVEREIALEVERPRLSEGMGDGGADDEALFAPDGALICWFRGYRRVAGAGW